MSLVIGLFWSLSVNGLWVLLFKKKFEETIPLTYIFGALCLYLFGLFNHISYGYCFSYLFAAAFFLLLLYRFIKKRDEFREFAENYITLGFLAYVILFVYIFFMQRYRGFSIADEFWNWGLQVREDFKYDSFISERSLYVNRTYPPFLTIVELLFCYFGRGFAEGYCFRALTTFCLILYLPLLRNLSIKKPADIAKAVLQVAIFILLGCCISITPTDGDIPHIYNTIYVDSPLALMTAYCFYVAYTSEKWTAFSLINVILSITALLLLKQTGIAFAALVILFLILLMIAEAVIEKKIKKETILRSVLLIVGLPLLIYGSWFLYAKVMHRSMETLISSERLLRFYSYITDPNSEKYSIVQLFIDCCFHRPLVLRPFAFTYVSYVLLMCVVFFVTFRFYLKDKSAAILFPAVYLFGAFAYAVARIYLFTSIYNQYQSTNLVSFDRYMKTYLYIATTLFFFLVIDKINKEAEWKASTLKTVLSLGLVGLLLEPHDLQYLKPLEEYKGIQDYKMTEIMDMVRYQTQGKRFLFIQQYQVEYGWQTVLNYVFAGSEYTVHQITLGPQSYDGQENRDISVEEYLKLLKNYDYIYLLYPDEVFIEKYWNPTTDAELLNQRLYHIDEITETSVKLTLIDDYYGQ